MVNRVVSTKLSEDDHNKLLEMCNDMGISVSYLVKKTILEKMDKISKGQRRTNSHYKRQEPEPNIQEEWDEPPFTPQRNIPSHKPKTINRYEYF